ncbi:MAG: hypothetical protein HQL31_00345 [Planctomycetes bacterium]|nr:hypothetical protein [Planctomycetota bacterium]
MSPRLWLRSLALRNQAAFLCEAAACLMPACALLWIASSWGWVSTSLLWPWLAPLWGCAMFLRFRKAWSLHCLFDKLSTDNPELKGRLHILADLLQNQGVIPDPTLATRALEQISLPMMDVSYPWKSMLLRLNREYPIALACLLLPLGLSQISFPPGSAIPLEARIVPPDYLDLPPRVLDLREHKLAVYPGTLLLCRIVASPPEVRMDDGSDRVFMPVQDSSGTLEYSVRLLKMQKLVLRLAGKEVAQWEVSLLDDAPPSVDWGETPSIDPNKWKPLSLTYRASDAIGLGDAFVTINDTELEYAGNPSGKTRYSYKWEFDPMDHLPLDGGNVELRIKAYDQNRILGPRSDETPPLIWSYEGIEKQVLRQLAMLGNLENKLAERKEFLNAAPAGPSPEIANDMKDLAESLAENPALEEAIPSMMQHIQSRYENLHRSLQQSPPNDASRKLELDLIRRDGAYLDFIKSSLQNLLSIIQAAELFTRLENLATRLDEGKDVDEKEMSDLFRSLKDHLENTDTPLNRQQEILRQVEDAQMLASLGERPKAAQALRKAAESLRKQSEEQNAPQNELAQRFAEYLERLKELILEEGELLRDHRQATETSEIRSRMEELNNTCLSVADRLKKLPEAAEFEAIKQQLMSALKQKEPQQVTSELLRKISQPEGDMQRGEQLSRLAWQLGRISDQIKKAGGVNSAFLSAENLLSPETLSDWGVEEPARTAYRNLLDNLKNTSKGKPSSPQESLSKRQKTTSEKGRNFAKDFREDMAPLFDSQMPFQLSDQAALFAKLAVPLLEKGDPKAVSHMQQAEYQWRILLDRLLSMQQRQQQMASGSGQKQKLRIGQDGRIELARGTKGRNSRGEEGQSEFSEEDIEVPEEFSRPELIEKRLNVELKQLEDKDEIRLFRSYILNLLQ